MSPNMHTDFEWNVWNTFVVIAYIIITMIFEQKNEEKRKVKMLALWRYCEKFATFFKKLHIIKCFNGINKL